MGGIRAQRSSTRRTVLASTSCLIHNSDIHRTIDSFPQEKHSPISDHGGFVDVMPTRLVNNLVSCIDSGQHCRS